MKRSILGIPVVSLLIGILVLSLSGCGEELVGDVIQKFKEQPTVAVDRHAFAEMIADEIENTAAASGTCGKNLRWYYRDGTLVIAGKGEMYDYDRIDGYPVPWQEFGEEIQTLVVREGCTSIGSYAFANDDYEYDDGGYGYNCTRLTNVILSDSVTRIGTEAFANTPYFNNEENRKDGCLYLNGILIDVDSDVITGHFTIPDGTRGIADDAFFYCSGLTSVTIPDSVTSIGANAFLGCDSLEHVTIPDSVTEIGEYAFAYVPHITYYGSAEDTMGEHWGAQSRN